ncbi:MAG: 23S rRNA (pseudouridine(1915)-N(3))-methyltransferase RlmH [Schwartzia sp.]|nr:23S rRNA (pseudouridine(1915)-N(3))-methyltransferase RlmH [Schwartzia sp. (in: firmicutes)]
MKITILAVGKLKEKYLRDGVAEYLKRLAPFAKVECVEIAEEKMPENFSPAEKEKTLAREGERLLARVPEGSELIVLDVAGEELSSEELAARLDDWMVGGASHLTFLIGGAFGLSPAVRKAAKLRLSFSRMTFTHQMVRMLLTEQIYRAFKIMRGEKYHW